jgi:uncharacterized protein YndB with AHSA1/START domain
MKKWTLRAVAAFGAILVLAVVVLFLAGLRPGAATFATAIEISAKPEAVWPWLVEEEKLKQWVSWLVEVRDANQRRPGAKQVWVMRDENNGGQLMHIQSTVLDAEEPQRLKMTTTVPGVFDGTRAVSLTPLDGHRTRVEFKSEYTFGNAFTRLLEPLITRAAGQKGVADAQNLKRLVEGSPAAAAR